MFDSQKNKSTFVLPSQVSGEKLNISISVFLFDSYGQLVTSHKNKAISIKLYSTLPNFNLDQNLRYKCYEELIINAGILKF